MGIFSRKAALKENAENEEVEKTYSEKDLFYEETRVEENNTQETLDEGEILSKHTFSQENVIFDEPLISDTVAAMLRDTISVEERLEELERLKKQNDSAIKELLGERELLLKAKNDCQIVADYKLVRQGKEFEEYIGTEDFQYLEVKYSILQLLKSVAPELYETEGVWLSELYVALEQVQRKYNQIEKLAEPLDKEGRELKADIIKFSNAVTEMKSKHKLSPDWEGKKQSMMNLQNQLTHRRSEYTKKEGQIEQKIDDLYKEYATVHGRFIKNEKDFITILNKKIEDFTQDTSRTMKLQSLLKEKVDLEKKERELK